MANIELNIPVNLQVSRETAQACCALLQLYLNHSDEMLHILLKKDGTHEMSLIKAEPGEIIRVDPEQKEGD